MTDLTVFNEPRCTSVLLGLLVLGSGHAHAATFTVTQSFGNAGQTGSLYWAITQSNATPGGPHTINFSQANITLDPTVPVPPITRNVFIDGDRGAAPDAEIMGSAVTNGVRLFDVATSGLVWIRNLEAGGAFRNLVYVAPGSNNVILSDLATDAAEEACIHVRGKTTMLRVTARNCGKRSITNAQAGQRSGIWVQGADEVQIQESFIGVDAAGGGTSELLANYHYGLVIDDSDDAFIGGTGSNGNVIANNGVGGVLVRNSSGTTIQNNRIGVRADGMQPLRNGFRTVSGLERGGIVVEDSTDLFIGGADPSRGNVVSSNGVANIMLARSQRIRIYGNRIGTNATGEGGWPAGQGLGIHAIGINTANGTTQDIDVGDIGSPAQRANTIGFHANHGIELSGAVGEFRIRTNSIRGNGTSGIRLGPGANSNLAAPAIAIATSTQVSGTVPLDVAGDFSARVDVYRDTGGQGQFYVGTAAIDPDFGTWSLPVDLSAFASGGWNVTATSNTDGRGTSQFSAPKTIVEGTSDLIFVNGFEGI